jgi:DNA-binding transcriptional LysR family regulator
MNLRQIEAFRSIIRHGTMTAAADHLRTSQPSISRLISELESVTKLRLFDRHGGRITPTEEGLAFYNEVEQSFTGLENLAQAAHDIRLFGSGRLRIGAIPAMALGFVPELLSPFQARFPNVAISLQMQNEVAVTRWIASRACDIGFTANVIEAQGVEVQPLYQLPGVCALPRDHRLARRKVITPNDLAGERFVSLALGDGARARTDQIFTAHGVTRSMSLETPFGATICALVGQGLGVGIVNPLVASDYKKSDIAFRTFKPDVHFQGNIIFRVDRRKEGLIDKLAELAQRHVRQYQS